MKALKPALVISLLANAALAWLLWNRNAMDTPVAVPKVAKTDARPAEMPLPALPRWDPPDDLRLRDPLASRAEGTLFTFDNPSAPVPEDPVKHFERTRNRNTRPAGPVKIGRDVPALDSDILRPVHFMAPYPSYRESQIQRGLYPGNPRRLP